MKKRLLFFATLVVIVIGCNQNQTSTSSEPHKPLLKLSEIEPRATATIPTPSTLEGDETMDFVLSDWTHGFFGPEWPIDKRCQVAQSLGIHLDLVSVDDQEVVNANDAVSNLCVLPSMGKRLPGDGEGDYEPFDIGFNNPKYTKQVEQMLTVAINHALKHKIPYVIVFTGMSCDLPPEEQISNLVKGFRGIVAYAEQKDVTLVLEMLNTKIKTSMKGHPGYFGDSTDITARIVREVDSPNLRLVFDFYHMHIMGENLLEMIEKYGHLVGYVHLAGAYPVSDDSEAVQRAELHLDKQQIDFPAIMAALRDIKYEGPVAFEYVPTTTDSDRAITNLTLALDLCS